MRTETIKVKLTDIQDFVGKEGWYLLKTTSYFGDAWYDEYKQGWFYDYCEDPYYMSKVKGEPVGFTNCVKIIYEEL